MSISTSLYTWLTSNSAISALVGSRVYPQVIPPAETGSPAITYAQENVENIYLLQGKSDLRIADFAIDCWHKQYVDARNLADTIHSELDQYRGTFGADTVESVRLTNDFEGPPDNDTGLYRVSLRFDIAYY